ncbi:MAG: DUF4249 family protein [Bacteroidales bacterium]
MKTIKYILLGLIVMFALYGCEYEIDYKGELPKDKLVVASFIEADSVISFSLYKSAKPGTYNSGSIGFEKASNSQKDISSAYVTDAKAELYIDGILKQTLLQASNNNKYTFTAIPRDNQKVEIKLNYKDYAQAIGKANLNLPMPDIDSSNVILQSGTDEYGNTYYRLVVYLEIKDNGNNENYYQIEPNINYDDNYGVRKITLSSSELLWENIQGVFQENTSTFESNINRFGVISNKKLKGEVYKVKFALEIYDNTYSVEKANGRIYGDIRVSSIEKQAYNYLFTLNRYYNSSYMNEPVIILDGIENAYGFIGGKKTKKVKNVNLVF